MPQGRLNTSGPTRCGSDVRLDTLIADTCLQWVTKNIVILCSYVMALQAFEWFLLI